MIKTDTYTAKLILSGLISQNRPLCFKTAYFSDGEIASVIDSLIELGATPYDGVRGYSSHLDYKFSFVACRRNFFGVDYHGFTTIDDNLEYFRWGCNYSTPILPRGLAVALSREKPLQLQCYSSIATASD